MIDRRCVILFVKLPEKGKVKSRLAQDMDEDFVLRLYESMVFDTIDMLKKGKAPFRICFFPPEALGRMKAWLGRGYSYMTQTGDDLGERMEHAFVRVFSEGVSQALLIGSDIPGLNAAVIGEAFDSLAENDAVIGPTDDGGYYLIGFQKNAFEPCIFRDMIWSTGSVYRETVDRLGRKSRTVHVLPQCADMDTKEDLKKLLDRTEKQENAASQTLKFLRGHRSSIVD